RRLLRRLPPRARVCPAGPLPGTPRAGGAGLPPRRPCTDGVSARLDKAAATIGALASAALTEAGVPHRLQSAGNMFSIFFTDVQVTDYESAKTQDVDAFRAFFHEMLARGVYLPPSSFEAWFVSAAIDDDALAVIAAALPPAARAAARAARG